MNPYKRFLLAVLVSLVLPSFVCANEVELFYFEKQKAFMVEGVEAGKFVFEEVEDESAVSGYEGPRHDAWWVGGDLSLGSDEAISFASYRTKRIAPRYEQRHLPRRYEVALAPGLSFSDDVSREGETILLLGWMNEGKIRQFRAGILGGGIPFWEKTRIELGEGDIGGRLVGWLVRDGRALKVENPEVWDRALLDGEVNDWDALAASEDLRERRTIHYAAANGDTGLLRALLERDRGLVKARDEFERMPLTYAVENGRSAAVSLLLEYKAPLADGWEDLDSIVRKAARSGHFDTLRLLAPDKARGREMKWHYSWAASDALNENYEEIAMYLIDRGGEFELDRNARGQFALGKAQAGYPDLALRLFEEFGIDPTYEHNGYSLMHGVAPYADTNLLSKVSSFGLKIGSRNENGLMPVDFAVGNGNVDAICWFIDNGARSGVGEGTIDPLKHAIQNRQLASVECLIGYGYDVNEEPVDGINHMMYAVFLEERSIAESLLDAGGAWLMDSQHTDLIVSRAIRMDSAELIGALLDQGWASERRLFGSVSLVETARFYQASGVLSLLEGRGLAEEEKGIAALSEVDAKPRLATPLKYDYPIELQEQFGSVEFRVRAVLLGNGQTALVKVESEPEREPLLPIVEKAVYELRFEPAVKDGTPVPVEIVMKLPLEAKYDPNEVFSLSDVEEKPTAEVWADPVYPAELLMRGVRGKVTVEFILSADGEVYNARPVERTNEAFARSAVDAVRRTVWKPAKKGGKPVACRVRVPINFIK